ncbi:MAG: (2Fe-2S)-binding protein [Spirochaetaceae bacterium]|nr:MAG: (2Fe-2S)-binding protein [Spirochaetaceae bacterium]
MRVHFVLNERAVELDVESDARLIDVLRSELRLSGTRPSCREGYCGSCIVLLDDRIVPSCLTPMFRVLGGTVTTIEGFMKTNEYTDIEKGYQLARMDPCRFCAAGKVLSTHEFIATHPSPTREQIRAAAESVWCRCTSYTNYSKAIRLAAEVRRRRTHARRRR